MSMNNNAPEKIYVHKSQYWGLMANVHNITENDVEYTRTDAFIEKACEWLKDNANKYWGTEFVDSGEMVEDFRKYMEGEKA